MFLYVGGMPSSTIEVWKLDPADLSAIKVGEAEGLHSPSFLCMHPTLPLLYAAERKWTEEDGSSGALAIFGIDPASGALTLIDRCRSGGAFTAHVNVSPDGRYLATANPRGPTVALFRLDETGMPAPAPHIVAHAGRGAKPRQSEPWPHSAYFDPAIRHVFACDLGLDRIYLYRIDESSGQLTAAEQPFAQVSSGAGARHMALAHDGRTAYVANELDSSLSVFRVDPAKASMWIVQTLSTIGGGDAEANQPAEVLLSPDGHYLYVTNRGRNDLAIFEVQRDSGLLVQARYASVLGETPRHAVIDGSGRLMAICNQASNEVRLFRLGDDGMPTPAGQAISIQNPTCVRFFATSDTASIA